MADTLWADISEFQRTVDNTYPHKLICIRSNDGTHRDSHFQANRAWCDKAVASGKLLGYIVYYFYRPTKTGLATCKSMVGTPNPKMALMIDVESAGGSVKGNQSATINAEYQEAVSWLGGNKNRVIGYGNVYDLNALWPQKPAGIRLVVANYSANPAYPGKFAHQFSDRHVTAPFGACDINSADGMAPADVAKLLGLTGTAATPKPPPSSPPPASVPTLHVDYFDRTHNPRCADVKVWQQRMRTRGWKITVDGIYGPASEKVCRQFQSEKKLAVDGKVGPQTFRAAWTAAIT